MTLNYKTYGTGEPLIVLHGLFGTADNWQTLAKQWAAHFTVFALDMRNHGRSAFGESHTYNDLTSDILEFMDTHNIAVATLLGHSMGGKAAMHFVQQHPERIKKLLIADIAPRDYKTGHEGVFEALFAVDLNAVTSRSEVESVLKNYIINDNSTLQFLLKNLTRDAETSALVWKINIPVLHKHYYEIIGAIAIPNPIDTPTLFLRGGNSKYINDADWSYIMDNFNDVRLATVLNAGHWLHAENPTDFGAAVLEFLL